MLFGLGAVKFFLAFTAAVFLMLATPVPASAYVYLAPQKPRLDPAEERTQYFYLTSDAPVFADKDSFEEGIYANDTDDAVFESLVQRSMSYWNDIPGLSIQLKVAKERKGIIDSEDNLFSIGIAKITTVASGLAFPVVDEKNTSRLRDCDIQVGTDISSIPSFVFVMVHELGHCLGLGHNHSDPGAIMGYWQPRDDIALGLDDMAGVLSLYPPVAGEKTRTFAPCGSIAHLGGLQSGGRLAQNSKTISASSKVPPGKRILPPIVLLLLGFVVLFFRRKNELV
ncbi:MAG: matrixin family metalloprotease [Silvanigrellaceae bacterium]